MTKRAARGMPRRSLRLLGPTASVRGGKTGTDARVDELGPRKTAGRKRPRYAESAILLGASISFGNRASQETDESHHGRPSTRSLRKCVEQLKQGS